ncbi:MAG TPA: TonB-dependent receptor [Pyrinomonadaceae bacterium]
MRVLILLVLIAASEGAVLAQGSGTLSGRVRHDGKPVQGATVSLGKNGNFAHGHQTQTDSRGEFTFSNIEVGSYTVKAFFNLSDRWLQRLGKAYLEAQLVVSIGESSTQSVELELEATDISGEIRIRETVVVSAAQTQPLEQVSKTVNTITGQEMRDRADFTLVDSLRTIPGFRIQQLGGFGRTASIKSRGLRNQDTAVLIDGIRFRDPGSITGDATPFLSDLTLTSVSRVEVLRGAGSSLYGTNAVGGTVDIQTPAAVSGLHGQVSAAAGGLGLGRFRANLSYGTDENKFGITGGFSRTAYTKGLDGQDNAGNTNLQTRIDYNPLSRTNISGRIFLSDADVRLNVGPDTLGSDLPPSTVIDAHEGVNFIPDRNDPDSIQNSRFFVGQFSVKHAFSSKFVLNGYHQGLVTKRRNVDGLLGPGDFQSEFTSSFGGTIQTSNVHATWTPTGSNTFTGGYEFESEHFRNEGSTPNATDNFWTRAGQRSNTLYAQHLASFFDGRLQLAGGGRVQFFSLGRPEFSETDGPYTNFPLSDPPTAYTFDGSASYFIPRTGTKFRVHLGNGYRVPSLYERFGTFFFFGSFFPQGNPGLEPERSLGIDAGVEQYFADDKVKASATYFYTRIKDEITYLPTDDFGAPAYYNFDRHFSRGFETSIEIKPTNTTNVFASYTFTNSDVRNFSRPTITTLLGTDTKVFGIPDHQFTVVATQRIDRFWVSLDLLATSSYLAPIFSSETFARYIYRFGGNRRVDLTAGYTFPLKNKGSSTVRVFGTIENVFDHQYFEYGFRTAGRNARVGLSFGF